MAIDIYGKQKELQGQIDAQKARMEKAKTGRNAGIDALRDQYGANTGIKGPIQGTGTNYGKWADEAAAGYQRAETAAARDEMTRYQAQLDEENQRIDKVKPLAELQEKQEMRAKQFRTAFPSILDSKLGTARTDARRKIAEGVNTARAGYNQRGLLYSGLRAGAEADVSQNVENDLANTAVKTNQELMDQGNVLDQDAIDTGLQIGNISKDLSGTNDEYRKSIIDMLINKDKQRQDTLGGLLGTGAQIAGVGLGSALK